jgi:hypothetical protein
MVNGIGATSVAWRYGPLEGRRKQGAGDLTRYLADMGIELWDIADILGSPVTSVRTLLTTARRK